MVSPPPFLHLRKLCVLLSTGAPRTCYCPFAFSVRASPTHLKLGDSTPGSWVGLERTVTTSFLGGQSFKTWGIRVYVLSLCIVKLLDVSFSVDRTGDLERFNCKFCFPPCLIPAYALCLHVFLSASLLYIYLMYSPQRVQSVCQE